LVPWVPSKPMFWPSLARATVQVEDLPGRTFSLPFPFFACGYRLNFWFQSQALSFRLMSYSGETSSLLFPSPLGVALLRTPRGGLHCSCSVLLGQMSDALNRSPRFQSMLPAAMREMLEARTSPFPRVVGFVPSRTLLFPQLNFYVGQKFSSLSASPLWQARSDLLVSPPPHHGDFHLT